MTNDSFADRLGLWTLAAFAPVLMFVGTNVDRNYQTDFWHHLARGRIIAEQGQLLNTDVFTCTVADQPLRDPNWVSQLCYYAIYQEGGLGLTRTVNSLVLAVMMALLVYLCWRAGGSLLLATALGAFAFFGLWQIVALIRPQNFSLLLFLLLYACLDRAEQRRRWLFFAPLLTALWANVHGAFPIAFVLIGAFLLAALWQAVQKALTASAPLSPLAPVLGGEGLGVRGLDDAIAGVSPLTPSPSPPSTGARGAGTDAGGEHVSFLSRWHRLRTMALRVLSDSQFLSLALCLLVSILATGLNPYGFGLYRYVGTTTAAASERGIMEWLPPGLDLFLSKVWVVSILLVLVTLGLSPRRPTPREICLIVCFLPPACGAVRMAVWWILIAVLIVAAHLGPVVLRLRRSAAQTSSSLLMGGLCLATMVVVVVGTLPGMDRLILPPEKVKPAESLEEVELAEVAQRLRQLPRGRGHIFARFEWGEYLGWALQPEGYRVFVDGRIEIIPDNVWADYLALLNGRADWQAILDRYQVNWLVLDTSYPAHASGLIPLVRSRPGDWEEVKVFPTGAPPAVLFLRKPARQRPFPNSQTATGENHGAR